MIHEIATVAGPAIGGFFGSARIKARGRHTFFIGLTLGIGWAIVIAIVAVCLLAFRVISTDKATVLIVTGLAVIALCYATGLGTLGAYFGGRSD